MSHIGQHLEVAQWSWTFTYWINHCRMPKERT